MAANEGEGSGFNFESDDVVKKFLQAALLAINACAKAYEAGLDVLIITGMHDVEQQKSMFSSMEELKVRLNHHVLDLKNWLEKMQGLEEIFGEDESMEEKREIKATAARLTESFNRKLKEYRDAVEDERKKREAQMQWIDSSVDSMIFLLSMAAQKASAKKEE